MPKYPILLSAQSGNSIFTILQPSIQLDTNKQWYIGLYSCSFFFTFVNISAAKNNNHFLFTIGATPYDLVINDGLYDIDLFSSAISVLLTNAGLPNNTFVFTGDTASQKVLLQINNVTATVLWLSMPNLSDIIGFTTNSTVTTAGDYVIAQNVANFNTISNIGIRCDAASGIYSGLFDNNSTSQAIVSDLLALVPITSAIGYQSNYQPQQILYSYLNSYTVDSLRITLTDQLGVPIEGNQDPWSAVVLITDSP